MSVCQFCGCRMKRIAVRDSQDIFISADFFLNFLQMWARLLDHFKNTNTEQAYQIITFVKSHKSIKPHHQGLPRCIKDAACLTHWLGCVNFGRWHVWILLWDELIWLSMCALTCTHTQRIHHKPVNSHRGWADGKSATCTQHCSSVTFNTRVNSGDNRV